MHNTVFFILWSFQGCCWKVRIGKIAILVNKNGKRDDKIQNLKNFDPTTIANTPDANSIIILQPPPYFKISRLKEIERNKIILEIQPHVVLTCICGDGCSVNVKSSRLLGKKFGIKSPFSRCASHNSAGTIHWLCSSETMSQADAKTLHENLRSLLKHFAKSPKSSEMFTTSLNLVEMHDVYLLNWGSTRMAGFRDVCLQALDIIIPFLETIIGGNRPEERSYIASPKGN